MSSLTAPSHEASRPRSQSRFLPSNHPLLSLQLQPGLHRCHSQGQYLPFIFLQLRSSKETLSLWPQSFTTSRCSLRNSSSRPPPSPPFCFLQHHNLTDLFTRITTNNSHWNEDGKLIITRRIAPDAPKQHGCKIGCSANMCKGSSFLDSFLLVESS